jgi:predicted permease
MSIWTRLSNVFRGDRLNQELQEELDSHIAEAIAEGRDPAEARRAFGSMLRLREESRDHKLAVWLDSLRADIIVGARQLRKNRTVTVAAVLSLALAIGACTSAFRLIDAMLLRPLPIADPGRLHVLTYRYGDTTGKVSNTEGFDYPGFRLMREAVKEQGELMAIGFAGRVELTYGSDTEMERAYRQLVSGWMMGTLGLKPHLGRLLTAQDDVKPDGHPVAVLSYDYWSRRFGKDPNIIGRTFQYGKATYTIVGVLEQGFTGTESGTMTDLFIPTMMNGEAINKNNWTWFRTFLKLKPGVDPRVARDRLQVALSESCRNRASKWGPGTPKKMVEEFLKAQMILEPAAAGRSGMQKLYGQSMAILALLVGMVLLIASANVANLMMAQASARAREMALRVSIGAGRWRLIQLMLVECALLAGAASLLGVLFAYWAAPFVVSMINPPDNPARLVLPWDWRVIGFAVAMASGVTLLFGLGPAWRASGIKPLNAIRGGEDPHARRRLMNALVGAQVAFCFLVHFVAGMFVASFERLSNQPTGYRAEQLLAMEVAGKEKQPESTWEEAARQLAQVGGVKSVARASWAPMNGNVSSEFVWANGTAPDIKIIPYTLGVGPNWFNTVGIALLSGRDFRPSDSSPGVVVVNQEFARIYFNGKNPVGQFMETEGSKGVRVRHEIVGLVRDSRYKDMREPIRPIVYKSIRWVDEKGEAYKSTWGTFMIRVDGPDPMALGQLLRQQLRQSQPALRVSVLQPQMDYVRTHTIRERLLATLSLFFAGVALLLAAVGLYGVLEYSVLQRRREIGIRLALGARADDIIRRVTAEVFAMLGLGAATGMLFGFLSEKYVETLLYQVKTTDPGIVALPLATILLTAALAAAPPVLRALRIDPAAMLRAD